MEPCLFRHGKEKCIEQAKAEGVTLQWSHVFSDMVSETWDDRLQELAKLQWSHVFSDMVSGLGAVKTVAHDTASMEPCLFRHGK